MEHYNKEYLIKANDTGDITYKSELTLDIFKLGKKS